VTVRAAIDALFPGCGRTGLESTVVGRDTGFGWRMKKNCRRPGSIFIYSDTNFIVLGDWCSGFQACLGPICNVHIFQP